MAKTSQVTIQVQISGDGETSTYNPPAVPVVNAAAPNGGTVALVLVAGNNTITPPVGSTGVVIIPDVASANVKKIKGVGGDTGITIAPAAPTFLALGSTGTFVINAVAGETVQLHWT
jgi:hypothetical protein